MRSGEYLVGAVFAGATVGACLLAAGLLLRRRLGHLRGSSAVLGFGVLATAALVAVQLVPAALGVLSRGSALAAALLLAAGAALVREPRVGRRPETPDGDGAPPWTWLPAGLAAAAAVGVQLAFLRDALPLAPTAIDALSFHLPGAAAILQAGSVWGIAQFVPDQAHINYPQNGDLLYLHTLLPFEALAFVRLTFVPFLALTAAAVYGLARELGAARAAAALAGATVVALPAVAGPALDNIQPDSVMLFALAAGLTFLLRHGRTGATSDLVLGGLALGLSFGTKWYGVSVVGLVVLTWLAARLAARVAPGRVVRDGAAVTGLVALGGGFWLLRNLIETGNPIFPVKVELLGLTLFDAPPDPVREQGGFTIAGYLDQPSVLADFIVPALERTLGVVPLVAAAGLALAAALALRGTGAQRPGGPVLWLSVLAVLVAIAYVATPYSALGPEDQPVQADANTRYGVPALLIAVALTGWAATRLGRWGLLLQGALALAAVDAARRAFDVSAPRAAALAFAAAVAAVAVVAAWRWARAAAARPGRWPRVAVAAGLAVVVVAGLAAGKRQVDRFDGSAWQADATLEWLFARAPDGARVGITGTYSNAGIAPILPAFGPRLGNEVEYLGPVVEDMQRQHRDAAAFAADARERDLDLLVVGLGFPEPRDTVPELRWARQAGWEPVARSERLVLLREPG